MAHRLGVGYNETVKVVLFCGGLGLRMREASERVPKPMVPIGSRPILWHVMKYFAHFGSLRASFADPVWATATTC